MPDVNWRPSRQKRREYTCEGCDSIRRPRSERRNRQRKRLDERVFPEGDRRGYVYAMTNPAWPGLVKIGSAANTRERLSTFNTGDPHRAFSMQCHVASNDRLFAERTVHVSLAKYRLPGGEWFQIDLETVERELFLVEEYEWEEVA